MERCGSGNSGLGLWSLGRDVIEVLVVDYDEVCGDVPLFGWLLLLIRAGRVSYLALDDLRCRQNVLLRAAAVTAVRVAVFGGRRNAGDFLLQAMVKALGVLLRIGDY